MKATALTFIACTPDAMWDSPDSAGLIRTLTAMAERDWLDHERELDLEREAELYPETDVEDPEIIPAEMVMDWDYYHCRQWAKRGVDIPQMLVDRPIDQ